MNTFPVIQSFFGKPVRFFKTEFVVELRGHHDPPALSNFHIETWAVPFPDFCRAIGYDERAVKRLIERSDEVFKPFYRTEIIFDMQAVQRRATILMSYEMCQLLVAKLETARIKDEATRCLVIDFQRWAIIAFHLLRTGKLRGVRWNLGKDVPAEVLAILSIPSGREHKQAAREYADKESISLTHAYWRLKSIRGSNIITAKGKPKSTRSDKGSTHYPDERQKAIAYRAEHPRAMGEEIKQALGLTVSSNTINIWIRINAA